MRWQPLFSLADKKEGGLTAPPSKYQWLQAARAAILWKVELETS